MPVRMNQLTSLNVRLTITEKVTNAQRLITEVLMEKRKGISDEVRDDLLQVFDDLHHLEVYARMITATTITEENDNVHGT